MLNIYIHKMMEGLEHLPILSYYFGSTPMGLSRTGDKARRSLGKQYFLLTEDVEKADYILLPHSYFHIKDRTYIDEFIALSQKYKKKILVFSYGDSDEEFSIPNSIIFRSSQYKYKAKSNEVIFPAIADDLLEGKELTFREKSLPSQVPVVGFCGWANFENLSRRMKEYLKVVILGFRKYLLLDTHALLHVRGILFRRRAISILKNSSLVNTKFIIRDSYSGSEKTRKIDAEQARIEYISNILDSDFALAVKGDGNFSIRLYEILSLGCIPLFIDTDCILPLEDIIDYNKFMIRLSVNDLGKIAQITRDFYDQISPDEFIEMQRRAREAFENYLRVDKYAERVFLDPQRTLLKKYE